MDTKEGILEKGISSSQTTAVINTSNSIINNINTDCIKEIVEINKEENTSKHNQLHIPHSPLLIDSHEALHHQQSIKQQSLPEIQDTNTETSIKQSSQTITNFTDSASQQQSQQLKQSQINQQKVSKQEAGLKIKQSIITNSSNQNSSAYPIYSNQYRKYSAPNRLFPVNNLANNTSSKLTSLSSQQSQNKSSAKVLRLLKKDIASVPSMLDSVSTASSIQNLGNINTQDNNIEEEKDDPKKIYESSQVSIDESNLLETKIHSWLDQNNINITCPSSKMHDYYDNIRQNTYWNIKSIILSETDLDGFPTPSTQSSQTHFNLTESPLPFTPTPRLERRISGQLTSLLPNCNFLNRRRITQKIEEKKPKEIEEERDEWDQD